MKAKSVSDTLYEATYWRTGWFIRSTSTPNHRVLNQPLLDYLSDMEIKRLGRSPVPIRVPGAEVRPQNGEGPDLGLRSPTY
ncbi:hypothetical protein M8J76_016415 [Diaphorina citri]|nr:hypothetical protein M8J76_016415 [Diaphorina citri]